MEALITLVREMNPYMVILILTLLICKSYRIGGILILMILIFTGGTIPFWVLGIIVMITLFTDFLRPYIFFKKRYEKMINKFRN